MINVRRSLVLVLISSFGLMLEIVVLGLFILLVASVIVCCFHEWDVCNTKKLEEGFRRLGDDYPDADGDERA